MLSARSLGSGQSTPRGGSLHARRLTFFAFCTVDMAAAMAGALSSPARSLQSQPVRGQSEVAQCATVYYAHSSPKQSL